MTPDAVGASPVAGVRPVRLIVYSDYLCPWCYNAAVRMRRLRAQYGAAVEIVWRSYLLRPRPDPGRSLESFRAYTRSWRRPAADPDAPAFRVWEGDAGPPSHSLPPHAAAKAAASLGATAFERFHARLLPAYFSENRDITETATLRAIWAEADLPEAAFARTEDPEFSRQALADHAEALELGITGVPAVRLDGDRAFIVGAHPYELYERWIRRALDRARPAAR